MSDYTGRQSSPYFNFKRDLEPLLQDGDWHSESELSRSLSKLIPPEAAIKRCQREGKTEGHLESQILWGKRRILKYSLCSWFHTGHVDRERINKEWHYRKLQLQGKQDGKTTTTES